MFRKISLFVSSLLLLTLFTSSIVLAKTYTFTNSVTMSVKLGALQPYPDPFTPTGKLSGYPIQSGTVTMPKASQSMTITPGNTIWQTPDIKDTVNNGISYINFNGGQGTVVYMGNKNFRFCGSFAPSSCVLVQLVKITD